MNSSQQNADAGFAGSLFAVGGALAGSATNEVGAINCGGCAQCSSCQWGGCSGCSSCAAEEEEESGKELGG